VSGVLPVRIVSSAARAIAEAADWWLRNRPKAPEAFIEELERALQLLASQPEIGARARNAKLAGVRRIHMARVHYHVYYRVISAPPAVEILALWHTSRGSQPTL
jgi:plasmid stabilization system protein ParE